MVFRYSKNSYYALYSNEDEYIAGFDKIDDLAVFLGCKSGKSLSKSFLEYKKKNSIDTWEDENKEIKTELLYIYPKKPLIPDGSFLKRGAKIYRFTEQGGEAL